jgi:hypothetical protein
MTSTNGGGAVFTNAGIGRQTTLDDYRRPAGLLRKNGLKFGPNPTPISPNLLGEFEHGATSSKDNLIGDFLIGATAGLLGSAVLGRRKAARK